MWGHDGYSLGQVVVFRNRGLSVYWSYAFVYRPAKLNTDQMLV